MNRLLIAICGMALGLVFGLLVTIIAGPTFNELRSERDELADAVARLEQELNAKTAEIEGMLAELEAARLAIGEAESLKAQLASAQEALVERIAAELREADGYDWLEMIDQERIAICKAAAEELGGHTWAEYFGHVHVYYTTALKERDETKLRQRILFVMGVLSMLDVAEQEDPVAP